MVRKRNLIPFAILAMISWIALGFLIYKLSPNTQSVLLFFLLLFIAIFTSFSLLLKNIRRGGLIGVGITILAVLRYFHFFHPLYIILLFTILLTIEFIFSKKK